MEWTSSWYPGIRDKRGKSSNVVAEREEYSRQRSSTPISTMAEAQMRADMVARALMDTRQQVAAVPKVTAPVVDTRTTGKAPTFTGEREDWPEWSFQFTEYMGSANPKSLKHWRWAAMEEDKITAAAVVIQSFEDHNPQLYLALALLCKVSALVTVKSTEVNDGLEAWRGLNATYESNNKGRQRVRMQYLFQPKRSESILQTTEAVERWNVRECEQRFGKTLDEDVKIGVILALAPPQVQNHSHLKSHILKSYEQVKTDAV